MSRKYRKREAIETSRDVGKKELIFCDVHLDFDCNCSLYARRHQPKRPDGLVPCYRHKITHRRDKICPLCLEEKS